MCYADYSTGINDNYNLIFLCSEFFVIHALQEVTFEYGITENAVAQGIIGLAKLWGKSLWGLDKYSSSYK